MYTLLLLLLSQFSCVRHCATPETAAHQAPLSLGFSRQEHWSGLPLPSPMYTLLHLKWITNKVLLHSTGNSAYCYVTAWMGGEFRGEWIHVWLSPFAVHLKLSQHFELTILQHWRRKWQPTSVFLPRESQGWRSLVGCHLWGRTELDMTEAT